MSDLELTPILAMPLDEFASHGKLLEVRVSWLNVTLWFVPESGMRSRSSVTAWAGGGCGRRRN
jgi:hypothetical protein